jgi:predicted metal-binding membrane protein
LSSLEKLESTSTVFRAPADQDAAKDAWRQSPSFLRALTLILLIEFAVLASVVLVSHSHTAGGGYHSHAGAVGHFLTDWAAMMVAMMFPTAALMVLAFYKDQAVKRPPQDAFVSTWLFVTAYLLVWILAGIAAYAGVLVAERAAAQSALGPVVAVQCGGAILLAAGLYQFTPLKETFLSECRTPIDMTTWRRATAGSFRMGLLHGVYCIGCNWLLFAALFPLDMTIGAMAVIALIILAEKTLPWPKAVSYTAGVGLVLYGARLIASPQL